MPVCRCSGVWSPHFETSTCATRPGPGRPRSIGREGMGGCTMVSHARQLSFGRTCRITLKLEGTYSSTSRSSWPMRLNTVPPQPSPCDPCAKHSVAPPPKGAGAGRRVGDGLARQMRRQRTTHRRLARARFGRVPADGVGCGSAFGFGLVGLELADQQFELLDLSIELLRGPTEPGPPQHCQLYFELLDVH